MQEDLDKEKKAITKQWAKREEQIDHVMQATVGMYGDLQGIAGKTLQEIEGARLEDFGCTRNSVMKHSEMVKSWHTEPEAPEHSSEQMRVTAR